MLSHFGKVEEWLNNLEYPLLSNVNHGAALASSAVPLASGAVPHASGAKPDLPLTDREIKMTSLT